MKVYIGRNNLQLELILYYAINYADKRIVNIMKVYIERNNLQLEFALFTNSPLLDR